MNDPSDLVIEARQRLEALSTRLAQRIGPAAAGDTLLACGIAVLSTTATPADLATMLRRLAAAIESGEGAGKPN